MITIGFSTRKIEDKFVHHIKDTCGVRDIEILPIQNSEGRSLTEVYNELLDMSSNDIVILCHDDIYFDTNNWGRKILKHFKRSPEYGILGVAGSKYLPSSGKWWEVQSEMIGIVNHEHQGKKWTSMYSEDLGNKIEGTLVTDGLFLIVNKKNIQNRFNPEVKGFHFYDIDFTYSNRLKGVPVGVIFDVRITHKSIGMTNDEWEKNRVEFSERYKENLPKIIPYNYNIKKNKKKDLPLVSIAMPIYNYAKMLNHTLRSVFNQDYPNFEIVIVDDGSDDVYCQMKLDTLKDIEQIRVIHKENSGVSATRNRAVRECKGDYILPLDADDMVLPKYIKKCVEILKNNPDVSPVYCDTIHAGEMKGVEKRPEWSKERVLKGPFIVNSSMYHKKAYDEVGGYDEEMKGWVDYDLWVRMSDNGYRGVRIPEPLFIYFHHESEGTVSTDARQKMQELYNHIMTKREQKLQEYE